MDALILEVELPLQLSGVQEHMAWRLSDCREHGPYTLSVETTVGFFSHRDEATFDCAATYRYWSDVVRERGIAEAARQATLERSMSQARRAERRAEQQRTEAALQQQNADLLGAVQKGIEVGTAMGTAIEKPVVNARAGAAPSGASPGAPADPCPSLLAVEQQCTRTAGACRKACRLTSFSCSQACPANNWATCDAACTSDEGRCGSGCGSCKAEQDAYVAQCSGGRAMH